MAGALAEVDTREEELRIGLVEQDRQDVAVEMPRHSVDHVMEVSGRVVAIVDRAFKLGAHPTALLMDWVFRLAKSMLVLQEVQAARQLLELCFRMDPSDREATSALLDLCRKKQADTAVARRSVEAQLEEAISQRHKRSMDPEFMRKLGQLQEEAERSRQQESDAARHLTSMLIQASRSAEEEAFRRECASEAAQRVQQGH